MNRRDDGSPSADARHPQGAESFGLLLRRYRAIVGLSQESLAEAANLSAAAVSALERGTRRAPYRETVAMLSNALKLNESQRAILENAADRARGRSDTPRTQGQSTNLPRYLTSFVAGNGAVIREAERLVANHRLVTLTGSGGIGKTRTALEIARRLPAGAESAFADLTSIAEGDFVVSVLAAAVGAPVSEQGASTESLATSLTSRNVLFIIDNCEHLIDSAAKVAKALLYACPGVRILATSRERLGVSGEVVLRLPSLAFPIETPGNVGDALSFEAIRLFVERAQLSDPLFALTDERIDLVSDICRRLDGIPLAIELAATRLPALGLRALNDQLTKHFFLSSQARDLATRQQTMLATISWSCMLLSDVESAVIRRISIFAGSFTLDAAVAVGADPSDGLAESDVPDVLGSLVDKSLVDIALDADAARYRLLQSVLAFQRERLGRGREYETCARRLAIWLVNFSDQLAAQGTFTRKEAWNAKVLPEFDNVRSVLDWGLGSTKADDAVLAGKLLGTLRSMWVQTGRRIELRRWAEAAIERIDDTSHPLVVAQLYSALLYSTTGDATFAAAERALELFERSGERHANAAVHGQLGYEYCRRGRFAEARASLVQAVSILRDHQRTHSLLHAGISRIDAWALQGQGKYEEARAKLAEAASIAQALDDDLALMKISAGLAEVEFAAGNVAEAVRLEEAILTQTLSRPDGNRSSVEALCNLGCFRLVLGELSAAEAAARNALRRAQGRYPTLTPWAIQHFAGIAALRGDFTRAARLLGYIEAWCRENGFARLPVERASYDILVSTLRKKLSPEAIATLRQDGEEFGFERAVEEVASATFINDR